MRCSIFPIAIVLLVAPAILLGQERPAITLVSPQPLFADRVTLTGRIMPVVSARIGARVAGHIAQFGTNEAGEMLDAGMAVKAGQVLFQIDRTTFENHRAIAQAAVSSAQAALANLKARTRPERLEQLRQAVAELDVRLADRQRDEQRFQRLVTVEKSLPARRLEEVQTEVASLKAQRASAAARLQEAENGATATELAIAEAQVVQAQANLKLAEDDLRDTVVKAPFDGLITRRFRSPGDYVTSAPLTEVLEILSVDRLEADLRIPEAYYAAVQAGKTQVRLRSPLLKKELTLPITRSIADIDPATGSFPVRVSIPAGQGLVAGAFVTADLAMENDSRGLIVPLRSIFSRDGKSIVFIARDGKMQQREVIVGDRLTEGILIRSGLSSSDKVIEGPADQLKDGNPLPRELVSAGK